MSEHMTQLKERILGEIRTGKARMEPKWHGILRAALYVSGVGVFVLGGIFVLSFVQFVLVQNGVFMARGFGVRAFVPMLFALPWMLVLALVVFAVALFLLVKKYAFVYRHPLVYGVVGVAGVFLVGGMLLAQLNVHERFGRAARSGALPFGGGLYREYDAPPMRYLHPGIVSSSTATGFTLITPRERMLMVQYDGVSTGTSMTWKDGDAVMILGERTGDVIYAQDVRRIDDARMRDRMSRRGRPMPMMSR